jgi:SAM-dependent methyltransferase
MAILDVGSGRRPALNAAQRREHGRYTGLDISKAELELAPPGSYDDYVVADVTKPVPALEASFDLVISWQVFEHVRPLDRAVANLQAYLRPDGHLVALFSGRFSAFGILNGLIPARVGVMLMRTLLRRDPESVFPAYYDRCYASALESLLAGFSSVDVTPIFQGGSYFNFALPLRRVYLTFEDWVERTGRNDLATHYLVVARR